MDNTGGEKESYGEWAEHWKKLVAEWQSSGLSQAEFCRQRSIKLTTFNFWKLRVLKQARGPSRYRRPRIETTASQTPPAEKRSRRIRLYARVPRQQFVPVVVRSGSVVDGWWCEITCRNGRTLKLREAAAPGDLLPTKL